MSSQPVYLDCNATTPIEPSVLELVMNFLEKEYANEGSRTHEHGARAKKAVNKARQQVASLIEAEPDEVTFTSGATESNNLAILGLESHGMKHHLRHIITTAIEHKAVLEPVQEMERRGFEVTLLPVDKKGYIMPQAVADALRPDTLLVSVMQVNNETGVRQPLREIADLMRDHPAFFHTDAAQGFGKDMEALQHGRLDLISVSGHKIYGPKGIGALIGRKRDFQRPPLKPLAFGGGQERGLRPGTLPVALIVGLGLASEMAQQSSLKRADQCREIKKSALMALTNIGGIVNGDLSAAMDNALSIRFPGIDSEALMLAAKDLIAISNGSACTSSSYSPSHVLKAMALSEEEINETIRLSWCHMTPDLDWQLVADRIKQMR